MSSPASLHLPALKCPDLNTKKPAKLQMKGVKPKAASSRPVAKSAKQPVAKHFLKKPAARPAKKAAARPKVDLIPQSVTAYLRGPPPTHPVRVWTVASDCSGLCTEGLASKLAFGATQEVKVIHKYASEVCPKKRPVISLKQFGNNCHVKVSRTRHQCPCARKFIQEAIGPDYLHHDMTTSGSLPTALWEDCDLYAVGFPCQSFSLAGKKQGVQDPRGQLMAHVPAQIQRHKPKSFLVENVLGLMQLFPKQFNLLVETLRALRDSSNQLCYLAKTD